MNFFDESIEDVYQKLETGINGLNKKERNKRIEKYGLNKLDEEKKEIKIVKFL